MHLKRRSFELITCLLTNKSLAQSIESLTKWFGITERTLRNEISNINDFLKEGQFEARIIFENGAVRVNKPLYYYEVVHYVNENNYYHYQLSSAERVALIQMSILSKGDEYSTIDNMAQALNVSRTSVINDLTEVREESERLGLNLISKPNKGLLFRNKEIDFRKAISILFLRYRKDADAALEQMLIEAFGVYHSIEEIKQLLSAAEVELGFRNAPKDREAFVCSAYVSLNRILHGQEAEEEHLTVSDNTLIALYRHIANNLGTPLSPSEEIAFNQLYMWVRTEDDRQGSHKMDLQVVVANFLYRVSDSIGIDFYKDNVLYENLIKHINITLRAYKANQKVYNPYLLDIESEYEMLFDIVRENIQVISGYFDYKLNQHEISFIAMHIGASIERNCNQLPKFQAVVVCHEGVATGRLLAAQLQKHFNIYIKEVLSAGDLLFYDGLKEVDLIISACALSTCGKPVVMVNPILNLSDIINVYKAVARIHNNRSLSQIEKYRFALSDDISLILERCEESGRTKEFIEKYEALRRDFIQKPIAHADQSRLVNLMNADRIHVCETVDSWDKAVRQCGAILVKHRLATPQYVEAILQNAYDKGPYFVITKGVALAHASSNSGVLGTGISLVILHRPVFFGHKEFDPVYIIFGLSAEVSADITTPLTNLITLCKSPLFLKDLRNIKCGQEGIELIQMYESGIMDYRNELN